MAVWGPNQVAASADDATEEGDSDFFVDLDYLRVYAYESGSSGNYNCAGARWANVTIAKESTIISAIMEIYVFNASYADPDLDIYCHDISTAPNFTDNANIISEVQRPRTTATKEWSETSIGAGWKSIDITDLIQEVINREDWSSGNALAVLMIAKVQVANNRLMFRSWDYDVHELGPKLTISYSAAPPAAKTLVQAVLISIPPLIVLPTLAQILRLTGGC